MPQPEARYELKIPTTFHRPFTLKLVLRYFIPVAVAVLTSLSVEGSVGAIRVRVATLNLDNYLIANRIVDGGFRPQYPKPEAAKEALRKVILSVDADVLAVQEMGTEPFLLELKRDLQVEGLDYSHTALMDGNDPDRHTAVLSKLPLIEVFRHNDLDFKYFEGREAVKRGLLEVVLETGGVRWSLFNLHLKSRLEKRPDDPLSNLRRRGEALAVRDFIRHKYPPSENHNYLIVGDLNGSRKSPPVKLLLSRGESILSRPVQAFDSRREVWTYFYARDEEYSRVDYILASPALFPRIVNGAGTVVDSPSMRDGSDHRMVYADILFPQSSN